VPKSRCLAEWFSAVLLILCMAVALSAQSKDIDPALLAKANAGDASSENELASLYEDGKSVLQDYEQAVVWYRKAAEQGFSPAQFNLGWMYETGHGIPQDFVQAAAWYRKAADQGDEDAQDRLGEAYLIFPGIPHDYAQAAEWFRKAAEQGLAEAQYKLGFQYDQGEGVPKDHEQAIVWYQKAAYQGNSRAIELLGYKSLMESGKAVPVKIIDRKTSETGYSYVVPAYSHSSSNTNLNCYAYSNSVNCSGRTRTDGYSTAPREISYDVSGATYSLLLPDGRIAVVNCESKFHEKFDYINRRDCRMPLVNDIQVEFKGKSAKLIWPVSLDGKTFESETYKIIAVRDR